MGHRGRRAMLVEDTILALVILGTVVVGLVMASRLSRDQASNELAVIRLNALEALALPFESNGVFPSEATLVPDLAARIDGVTVTDADLATEASPGVVLVRVPEPTRTEVRFTTMANDGSCWTLRVPAADRSMWEWTASPATGTCHPDHPTQMSPDDPTPGEARLDP